MKKAATRYLPLVLALVLVSAVCLLFAQRKSGMFIDEIYTYGLSNSHYAPYLTDVQGGSLTDRVMTRQQLLDYVSVGDDDRFDFGSVYYNQERDVHPPLYYWLFNIVYSLNPHSFSMVPALILDYLLYLTALLLLYALVRTLGSSQLNGAVSVVLYGLSVMGLSTMLMIRMYVLMTALSVLLALLTAKLIRQPKKRYYPMIGLCIFLGLMTQYYFVFYAFFLCAAYVILALIRKDYKGMLVFAVCAFLGVGCLLLAFPACLDQLFADALVSGGNALENLGNTANYKTRLLFFISEMRHGLKAVILAFLLCAVLSLLCCRKIHAAGKAGNINWGWLVILLPALPTFVLVALISPVLDQRYVYNLAPIFVLAVSFLFYLLEQGLSDWRGIRWAAPLAALLLAFLAVHIAHYSSPAYLYPEYREYNALLSQHAEDPCVYMTDDYFAPVTESLEQLLVFDDFFVTGDADSTALDAYLEQENSEECVVYIDVSEFWSSGFKPEEILPALLESTAYTDYAPLYRNGLSEAYLLTK